MLHGHLILISGSRGFFENVANSLERSRQRRKILRIADRLQRLHSLGCIHQVVRTRGKGRVDLVVGKSASFAQDKLRPLKQKIQHLLLDGLRSS